MPRPRIHDPDSVLDATESLAVRSGPAAVTIRAVAAATGASNGAIYHTFGSRAELLGRTWLRAARRYLAMQTELVEAHLGTTGQSRARHSDIARDSSTAQADAVQVGSSRSDTARSDTARSEVARSEVAQAVEAVLAAAEAPVAFAQRFPDAATLLLTISRNELLGDELPAEVAAELAGTDDVLVQLMVRLARALWGRGDAAAVDVITTCVVDLPTAILLRRNRLATPLARQHLRAAVRAVLEVGPPNRPDPHPTMKEQP